MKEQRLEILRKVAKGELTPEQGDEQLLGLSIVSKRLDIGTKVKRDSTNQTGVIIDKSDIGFSHFIVRWDLTWETSREYSGDLNVC